MFDGMWWAPWGWLIMSLLMVGFWVLVIVVIVSLVRKGSPADRSRAGSSSALHVLEERYARGEMSREEFLERRAVLLGQGRPEG